MSEKLNPTYLKRHVSDVMTWEQKCVSFVESIIDEICEKMEADGPDFDGPYVTTLPIEVKAVPVEDMAKMRVPGTGEVVPNAGGCASVKVGKVGVYIHAYL